MIFKRKSHAGRLLANQSAGVWIFGGICRENGEALLDQVHNRSTETLLHCIQERILPGTRIISDCWRAYAALAHTNYERATVNHTYNFLNPEEATINTQRIERMWRTLKQIIPKASNNETRWTYLAEFIFKQRTGWHTLSIGSRIELILDHEQYRCPPVNTNVHFIDQDKLFLSALPVIHFITPYGNFSSK